MYTKITNNCPFLPYQLMLIHSLKNSELYKLEYRIYIKGHNPNKILIKDHNLLLVLVYQPYKPVARFYTYKQY